ncbi:hypothetical protein [Nonomuraea sp. NPDC049607]|uniref:hypothetical protein n=1 Tax=Nonomuraea sp. NPDC049607 TaxID=3154732 RepID=UPI003436A283
MTQTLPTRPELSEEAQPEKKEERGHPILRAMARGAVGSMAMSGLRQLTVSLGMVDRTPPESVLRKTAPQLFRDVPAERRPALVEAVHWLYGAAGGAGFGLLPRAVRERRWSGPLYGVLAWAAFEAGIAPALGLPRSRHTTPERLALLADHLLYGAVVGSSARSRPRR